MIIYKKAVRASAIVLCIIAAPTAFISANAQAADDEGELAEITVTAQKTSQNLQRVPIAVTAVTAEALSESGARDLQDLVALIPGVTFQDQANLPVFAVRGISLLNYVDTNESPVAAYSDGVYLGTPSGQRGPAFDLNRVEFLRGPQGTLFGRNSVGGLIQYISNGPTDDFDYYGSAEYGSYNERTLEGAVSGPIAENLTARLAVRYVGDDGWQTDAVTGRRYAKQDLTAARAQIQYKFVDTGKVLIKLEHINDDGTPQRYGFSGLLANPVTGAPCTLAQVNAQLCYGGNGFREPVLSASHPESIDPDLENLTRTTTVSATVTYVVSDVTLTSQTAYENLYHNYTEDTGTSGSTWNADLTAGSGEIWSDFRTPLSDTFSQEFRADATSGSFKWQAGAFYWNDKRAVSTFIGGPILDQFTRIDTESEAIFGQVETNLGGGFSLTTGVRGTSELKKWTNAFNPGTADEADNAASRRDNKITGRIGPNWQLNEDTLIYASYSTGFKSANFDVDPATGKTLFINPETIAQFEVGLKTEFLDRRGRVDAAVFHSDYKNAQSFTNEILDGAPYPHLVNVGNADIDGLELETAFKPTSNLEFGVNYAWTPRARISSHYFEGPEALLGYPIYYNGNTMPLTPKQRVNASAKYSVPLGDKGSLFVGADVMAQSHIWIDAANEPLDQQGGYAKVNAKLGWNSPDKRWTALLYVENATDKQVASEQYVFGPPFSYRGTIWDRPRWIGFRVTFHK
jgi:iron complex outermembrane receptor protein